MITFLIYIVGYIFAYLQHRKNDRVINRARTNSGLLLSLVLSLFSWLWFLIALCVYLADTKYFNNWLKKPTKY